MHLWLTFNSNVDMSMPDMTAQAIFEMHRTSHIKACNCTTLKTTGLLSCLQMKILSFGMKLMTNDNSSPKFDCKQGTKCSEQHLKKKLSYSNVSPKE